MAAIQAILERLLVPDNAVIQQVSSCNAHSRPHPQLDDPLQATRDLQAVYRNPEVIPSLCTLLHSSPNPQVLPPSLPPSLPTHPL